MRDTTSLVDIHSHLVPGVDDGARDVAAVVKSVERLTEVGVRRIVTTPHIQGSLTANPSRLNERLDAVSEAFDLAAAAIGEHFPEVEYRRGHEVLIDVPEPDLSDPRIRLCGTRFVLMEWPRLHVPPGTPRVIRWVREQGYLPIIAHPERYGRMSHTPDLPAHWRAAGAFLQVNYGSLVGRYGAEAQIAAFRIVEAGFADYLASDFHGQAGLKIYKSEAWAVLEERGGAEALDTLCRVNPSRLLEDLEPLPAPTVSQAPGLLGRLRSLMRKESA